jgi:putative ABC transport system permease protein
MILSGASWDFMKDSQWTSNNLFTYFKLHPNMDVSTVKDRLDEMTTRYIGAELERYVGLTFQQFLDQGNSVGFFIQPMLKIHLYSDVTEEITPNGNIQYLYIFGAIALFIILIACINFMNLSTARSANRAKEVGVRKTIGALRGKLMGQFLAESMIYSFLSAIAAFLIISAVLTPFNILAGKNLSLSFFANPLIIGGIIIFTILIGLIAGSYPAFYLTSFKPAEVLKGKIRSGFRNSRLRNVLVVFQFIISIALILGSLIVYEQLKFMQEKNLGFDKENMVSLLHTMSLGKNAQAFKNELTGHTEFAGASFANRLPPNIDWGSAFRKGGTEQDYLLTVYLVDFDHLETMGYEMSQGRFFSREFSTDDTAIILNEAAFRQMGFEKLEDQKILSYFNIPDGSTEPNP